MSEILNIASTRVEPGNKVRKEIKVAELTDSSPVNIPVILINGHKPGPRLCMAAAYHGDEYNGIEVARSLAKKVNPEELSGSLISVIVSNPLAYQFGARTQAPFTYDLDFAGPTYPGDPEGSYNDRVGHFLFNEIFTKCSHIIDYHGGATHWMARYIIATGDLETAVGKTNLEIARAFGTGLPIKVSPVGLERESEYTKRGISHIIPELGGSRKIRKKDIDRGITGVENVMKYLGMLEGQPEPSTQIEFTEFKYIRANHGGLLRTELTSPDTVKEGDTICTITNLFGDVLETITAPYNSVIFCSRFHSAVRTGDWLFGLGRIE